MSETSCPVSGSAYGRCPAGASKRGEGRRVGPRGCSFSGMSQTGDVRAAFRIPDDQDAAEFLRLRDRKAINEILYSEFPSPKVLNETKNVDTLPASDLDVLAVALGAPARQVIIRAEEIGPKTGWKDGFLTAEFGFVPPDMNEIVASLGNSPGRVWSDLAERVPGALGRGRLRECVEALPLVQGTEDVIPDSALWAALVALGMLCSIYRYEEKYDGHDGVSVLSSGRKANVEMSDDVVEELKGIPKTIGVPYFQISKRMGRAIPHLSFPDQSSYNIKVLDPTSDHPYVCRFDNMDLRWPMFGERSEIAFLKGCADTSGSFQHGPDAIASCQEAVMNRDNEALLREMIRLKDILELMPNAFHTISPNPSAGNNFVAATEWVRWGQYSSPLSQRTPAASGLQFPPYLLMDAFLGRKKYGSFLGAEAIHLRAWQPSNLRAFIAAVEYHYSVPEYVAKSGDPRLLGVFDGIIEAYTGERGFMGIHRYKVFGILEVAAKTGRVGTNGNSGSSDTTGRPWDETHKQFSEAMKERLEPYRGDIPVEPHQMRGTFEECRYASKILSRSFVDNDPDRSIAMVTFDIQDTGVTFHPGDRLAVMPLNNWDECAKVALALGLEDILEGPVKLSQNWSRFAQHLGSVTRKQTPQLTIRDIVRRGHLAPLTRDVVMKIHTMLRASSSVVVQVLASTEWPVRGSLGDLLQAAVMDTPEAIWDQAFDLSGDLSWLSDLIAVEVPRTYSISNYPDELLPSTIDLSVSRAEFDLSPIFSGNSGASIRGSGVGSGFLNPFVASNDELMPGDEEVLIGVSRPVAFGLPLDGAAPCAFFAGGSGIAPFRSFWQSRAGRDVGRNILYLGVQSREKFCYENELRQHVNAGHMEVHTAFSRDSRGLAYDRYSRDLVEKTIPPRYIDALIVEQGDTVCDLVMSKKQGGLGGHLYVCGSVSVFDSVMKGIRQALYHNRTATMESTDVILSTAFAERRIQLDVFMTPKPLPCNTPTIPQSQLAKHTGHRPDTPIWIGVHGKVYDVTSFCPMHPGGTLIIQSNAGVDASRPFDDLAHSTNPEVTSLLTKYFVGNLTPKPDFPGMHELSGLYDMWHDYMRTVTETLVAQQFEMNKMAGAPMDASLDPSSYWSQGNMLSIKGIRLFYQYQSRLLQGGFSALFGAKFQELVLKLSFSLANASTDGSSTRLPDVLGIIARAKGNEDAVTTSRQISLVGEFISDHNGARFHEKGIIAYASNAVELDIALLEDIREEACHGMDAFESIADLNASVESQAISALVMLLMQLLERMAKRLEIFYAKLAQHSIYQPSIERNPARTRWRMVRQRVKDGSFFILAQNTSLGSAPSFVPDHARPTVEFDNVISRVQQTLNTAESFQEMPRDRGAGRPTLSEVHTARGQVPVNAPSAFESHENNSALRNMSSFIDRNLRSIRRLSKVPTAPVDLDMLSKLSTAPSQPIGGALAYTPPSSRGSSRSPTRGLNQAAFARPGLSRRSTASQSRSGSRSRLNPSSVMEEPRGVSPVMAMLPMRSEISRPPTPPMDGAATITSMIGKFNSRTRPSSVKSDSVTVEGAVPRTLAALSAEAEERRRLHARQTSTGSAGSMHGTRRSLSTNSTLRSFRLGQRSRTSSDANARIAPTF